MIMLVLRQNLVFFLLLVIMAVSLVSINVNGIAERHKRVKVFECLKSLNFDLFFLQETHLADSLSGKAWENDWGAQCAWSPGSNRSAGVAVLVHPKSSVKIADFHIDLAGMIVTVKLEFDQCFFQVVNRCTRQTSMQKVNYFLTISGAFHFRISTPLWSVILIVFQIFSWTNGAAMTALETGLSHNSMRSPIL